MCTFFRVSVRALRRDMSTLRKARTVHDILNLAAFPAEGEVR